MVFFQKLFDESQTCCVFELALEEEPIVTKKNQTSQEKKTTPVPMFHFSWDAVLLEEQPAKELWPLLHPDGKPRTPRSCRTPGCAGLPRDAWGQRSAGPSWSAWAAGHSWLERWWAVTCRAVSVCKPTFYGPFQGIHQPVQAQGQKSGSCHCNFGLIVWIGLCSKIPDQNYCSCLMITLAV